MSYCFLFFCQHQLLKCCENKQQWKKKTICSITRRHTYGGPYHTPVQHSSTRQGHKGIQALSQRRIWENFSAASSRTRQKNALENMQHSFSMTDLDMSCWLWPSDKTTFCKTLFKNALLQFSDENPWLQFTSPQRELEDMFLNGVIYI